MSQPWREPKEKEQHYNIILAEIPNEDNPNKKGDTIIISTQDLEAEWDGKTYLDIIVDEINTGTPYNWGYFKDTLKQYGVIEDDTGGKVKKAKKEDYMLTVKVEKEKLKSG